MPCWKKKRDNWRIKRRKYI